MAYNTFSHSILSAQLLSYPELALGSGYYATCSNANAKVVSLTAGSEVVGDTPLLSGGIGVVGGGIATLPAKENGNPLSGSLGIKKLGAIGTHPVVQLLWNPPTLCDNTAGANTAIPDGGVAPLYTGTCSSKGYGNLNSKGGKHPTIFEYELISPEATETRSHHGHLSAVGSTIVASSISGITVALRTGHASERASRHSRHRHKDSGIEVQYYLGDPLAAGGCYMSNALLVSAGLSSRHSGFVGPEHARKRLMGF